VILPQALRSVVGPIGNIFIALIKNSSIAGAFISVGELFRTSQILQNETAQPVAVFLGTAVAYLLLTIPAGRAFSAIEQRVAVRR
jgi:ABC-type amino acid transport system permease subunit